MNIEGLEQIIKDINYESEDLIDVNFDKFPDWQKCNIGSKISWCYKQDVKFWKSEHYFDSNPKDKVEKEAWYASHSQYRGILFTLPEKIFRIDENAVVCCYDYPIEKENATCFWISLDRLLLNEDLYKIYKI